MKTTKKFLFSLLMIFALVSCEKVTTETLAPSPTSTNNNTAGGNTSPVTPAADFKDFTLTSDLSTSLKLSDNLDNVIVLFFFGNGCSSCKAFSPMLQTNLVEAYTNKKVRIIGLDTWDGNLASVKSFKSATGLTIPLLLEASDVAKTYETSYDRIIVLDKKGVLRFKGTQLARNDFDNAKKVIDTYLAK